ncbi:transcriptional regulator [Hamadaea flava]|uniref:transcriptional regulator n=1 Tax=Hamadaea flava TaxID=1742688 RepID=UPI0020A34A25|nr:transcriptional regulator [Hamadaea flava]
MTGFDEAFATLPRLKVAAFLSGCEQADFLTIAERCDLAGPTLSKAIVALEELGYLQVEKGYVGRRPRTWVRLSPAGTTAFTAHLAAVRGLAESATEA